jgi:hypothetical protein
MENGKEKAMKLRKLEVLNKEGGQPKALLTLQKDTPIKDVLEYLKAIKRMHIDSVMIKVDMFHF